MDFVLARPGFLRKCLRDLVGGGVMRPGKCPGKLCGGDLVVVVFILSQQAGEQALFGSENTT